MFVTKEDLIKLNACKRDLGIFTEEWPNGVEVTEESLGRAFKRGAQRSLVGL